MMPMLMDFIYAQAKSQVLVWLGEFKVVCVFHVCIEVHPTELFCSLNGSKATTLISRAALYCRCFL